MSVPVREATVVDAAAASAVVRAAFVECVAPDWEASAVSEFVEGVTPAKLENVIREATLALVYEVERQVVGFLSLPRPALVQLFFVAPNAQRKGVGHALWEAARSHVETHHPEVRTVELNSTPYAFPAYKALGFYPISTPFRRKGTVATRMACWLPGRALAQSGDVA